jgi:hypothetical protein
MNLVQRNWESLDPEVCKTILDEQIPADKGRKDLRGFEWFYWQRRLSSEVAVVNTGPTRSVTMSPDFQRIASVDFDGKLTVRDATTGREIFSLRGRDGGIIYGAMMTSLIVSPM